MPRLMVDVVTDVNNVEAKLGGVGTAAKGMASDVDAASRKADAATGRLDNLASSADGAASSSAQAAGGLGDLGGALSLLPGPLGAVGAGMEAVAPAVMGVTGAADLASLALEKGRGITTKLTTAIKANIVVQKASAVAQKVLNLAMRANPLGLVIVAITALVALFVVLYKKSETFRNFVDKLKDTAVSAFKAILGPVQAVIDKVQAVVGFVGDAISATKRAIGLGKEYGSTMDRVIGNALSGLAEVGAQVGQQVRGDNRLITPSEAGRVVAADPVPPALNVTVNGALDPTAVAKQILDIIARYMRLTGKPLLVTA